MDTAYDYCEELPRKVHKLTFKWKSGKKKPISPNGACVSTVLAFFKIYIFNRKCVHCVCDYCNNSSPKYYMALQHIGMRRKLLSLSVLSHSKKINLSNFSIYSYNLKTSKQCPSRWSRWRGGGWCLSFPFPEDAWFNCVEWLRSMLSCICFGYTIYNWITRVPTSIKENNELYKYHLSCHERREWLTNFISLK